MIDLIEMLQQLPPEWVLTPVKGKRPMRPNWQSEPALDRGYLAHQLLNGTSITRPDGSEYTQEWDGFGIRTGSISSGVLGIDVDGTTAEALLKSISDGELPQTVSWTSDKPGRRAMLYQISEDTQAILEAAGGWSGKKLIAAPGQELHFRFDGWQQVLPPSAHPETGCYRWTYSVAEVGIAPAPAWLEKKIISWVEGEATPTTTPAVMEGVAMDWPLLPPMSINGPGQTNDAIRQVANWGYNKLKLQTVEELGNYITENAPKLPGWREFVSSESRADLGKDWGYRWAKSACKYWSSPRAQQRINAPDTQWQDWLQQDASERLQWCIEKAKATGVKFISQNQLFKVFIDWAKQQFGRGFSRSTLLKLKERWLELLGKGKDNTTTTEDETVQEVPNRIIMYRLSNKDHRVVQDFQSDPPKLTSGSCDLSSQTLPTPNPVLESRTTFQKGDRVIMDDGTGLPYCGREATVTAITQEYGVTVYRLDLTYTGRRLQPRQRKNAITALPQFLAPAPIPQSIPPEPQPYEPDWLEVTTAQLDAVLGNANPFCGGHRWRVSVTDIGKAAFQRLKDALPKVGEAHA